MFELIALTGGFWFFCFMLIVLGSGILFSEIDNWFGAAITIIVLLLGSELIFGIPVFAAVVDNPLWVVFGLIVYALIGTVYATFYRYRNFLKDNEESIARDMHKYEKSLGKNGTFTNNDFRESMYYSAYQPYNNKERITAWILLWPWAVFWDLCHQPVRWVYKVCHDSTGKILDKISYNVSEDIINRNKISND